MYHIEILLGSILFFTFNICCTLTTKLCNFTMLTFRKIIVLDVNKTNQNVRN